MAMYEHDGLAFITRQIVDSCRNLGPKNGILLCRRVLERCVREARKGFVFGSKFILFIMIRKWEMASVPADFGAEEIDSQGKECAVEAHLKIVELIWVITGTVCGEELRELSEQFLALVRSIGHPVFG